MARAVLSGRLRGISRGAVRFYDPAAQLAAWLKWKRGQSPRKHCSPLVVLERWAFGYPWADKAACTLDRSRPQPRLEWVGPIPDVNPLRLMLLRPGSAAHGQQFADARQLVERLEGIT